MLRKLIGTLLFMLFTTAVYAAQHTSSFGYLIDIPDNWLVFSQAELRDNPDLFNVSNPELKKINPELMAQISGKIKSGDIEIYFNPGKGSTIFADNINAIKQIGQLPKSSADFKKLCSQLPDEFSNALKKPINVYQCTRATVGGKSAMIIEFDGVADGTRSIQYQVQKSENILLIFTGSFTLQTLADERQEYLRIVESIRFK